MSDIIKMENIQDLRWKSSTAKFTKTRVMPKAFTEKGLYMLATILKSPQATQTTIAIIEIFQKLSRYIKKEAFCAWGKKKFMVTAIIGI